VTPDPDIMHVSMAMASRHHLTACVKV